MKKYQVLPIIMAAGKGTRMKSQLPKVLHQIGGKPLVKYVIDAAQAVSDCRPILVVGHGAESVMQAMGASVDYALQQQQLGTGHAVMMAQEAIDRHRGYVMVLVGDAPLIQAKLLDEMLSTAEREGSDAVLLSAMLDRPFGYGRIVRDRSGAFLKIVEERDASDVERELCEVNASVYVFKSERLYSCLQRLSNDNVQGEYYLTDVLCMLAEEGRHVHVVMTDEPWQMMAVNDRVQLAEVGAKLNALTCERHMRNGVTLIDPSCTYIGPEVAIGNDTIIYPGNHLEGNTLIESECTLYPNNRIVNSHLGCKTVLQSSVVLESSVGSSSTVGPYAYLRPGSEIGDHVRIGDFVEVKNSRIHDGAKVSHLTYVGDGEIGQNTNIGCGVVFVNYDGKNKHRTTVGSNAFIGCNVNLVAPVTVEDDAYIAAGSTITERVEAGDLAIARQRQTNKKAWAYRKNNLLGGNE